MEEKKITLFTVRGASHLDEHCPSLRGTTPGPVLWPESSLGNTYLHNPGSFCACARSLAELVPAALERRLTEVEETEAHVLSARTGAGTRAYKYDMLKTRVHQLLSTTALDEDERARLRERLAAVAQAYQEALVAEATQAQLRRTCAEMVVSMPPGHIQDELSARLMALREPMVELLAADTSLVAVMDWNLEEVPDDVEHPLRVGWDAWEVNEVLAVVPRAAYELLTWFQYHEDALTLEDPTPELLETLGVLVLEGSGSLEEALEAARELL